VSIFIKELSALESIVKYLRETYNLRFCDIAKKLNRDQRTIWTTYAKSKKKHPVNLNTTYSEYFVPVKIFQERVYGVLEILVHYLKKHYNLKYSEIGKLLNRNQRTVWTVNSRYKKKEVEYA